MKDYNITSVPLSKIHEQLFSILVEFDRICVKHGINYTLEGGTLLGAKKYKGFVPWDDDIDVAMLREDYEKFLNVAKSELKSEFFLQNCDSDANFPLNYSKLRLNGTKCVQANYEFLDIHHGLFMDIFPYDYSTIKTHRKKLRKIGAYNGAKMLKMGLLNSKISFPKKVVYKFLSSCSLKTLNKKIQKIIKGKKSKWVYNYCNPLYRDNPMPVSSFKEYTRLEFMSKSFLVIKDYEAWLEENFGKNYMESEPNIETRGPSHAIRECSLKPQKSVKKIGILTFHQANNYGAVLQGYALARAIKKISYENDTNIVCEIVDYENEAIKKRYKVKPFYQYKKLTTKIKRLMLNRYVKKNNEYFDIFRKNYLPLGKIKYNKQTIYNANEEYNVFITGSDQVFNYLLTDNDTTYYLDFVNDKNKKIGYAVSVGNSSTWLDNFEKTDKLLSRFNIITARETDLYSALINKGYKDTVQVLDPSFLLDVEEYKSIIGRGKLINKKFVLVYVIGSPFNDRLYGFAKNIAESLNAEIVYINTDKLRHKGVINLRYVPIQSFLWLIKNASCVITTSFHGLAYSLVYNTNVYYKLAGGNNNFNSRLTTLSEHFNLSSRNIDNCISTNAKYSDMDWENINKKITLLKEKSLRLLKEIIIDD